MKNVDDVDTIVCSAKAESLKNVFLEEKRWYPVRMHSRMLHKIKYLAIYEASPTSAIRYIDRIKQIKPYENDSNDKGKKYELVLVGNPLRVKPIKMTKETIKLVPQSPRYTSKKLIENGNSLRDIF